jgi:hypothetical protein
MNLDSTLADLRQGRIEPADLDPEVRAQLRARANWPDVLIALGYEYFKVSISGRITYHPVSVPR